MRLYPKVFPDRFFRHRRHVITISNDNLLSLPTTSFRLQSHIHVLFRYVRTTARFRPRYTQHENLLLRKQGSNERRRRLVQLRTNDNDTRVIRISIVKQIGYATMRGGFRFCFDEST